MVNNGGNDGHDSLKPDSNPIFMKNNVGNIDVQNRPPDLDTISEDGKQLAKPDALADYFPKQLPSDIDSAIIDALDKNKARYAENFVLGYPGTTVHPIGEAIMARLTREHINHIGMHSNHTSEGGFAGTQALEREAISMIGSWLGEPNADGYFTSGGTEANTMGCWVGREQLLAEFGDPVDQRITVIASMLTHYSFRKICSLLKLGEGTYQPYADYHVITRMFRPNSNGSGLHFLACDEFGAIARNRRSVLDPITKMKELVVEKYQRGIRRFLIILNAGTAHTGGVDDILGICQMLTDLGKHYPGIGFYVHVDAAHGGFIGPFLPQPIPVGFEHPLVSSVTVDPHKMGLAPYPAGIFLSRPGLPDAHISREVGYIASHKDNTISGSRSGATAVATWATMKFLGREGYRAIVGLCTDVTNRFREEMSKIKKIHLCGSDLNIICFSFESGVLDEILNSRERRQILNEQEQKILAGYDTLTKKWFLPSEWLPSNLGDLESRPRRMHKIVIMPHDWVRRCPEYVLQNFIDDLHSFIKTLTLT